MAQKQQAPKEPRIVAELGRPETPEETAARKAETTRKHRANQTTLNLVVALVASLAIVLFLVVVVVRPAAPPAESVDYSQIAQETGQQLVAPVLPPEWSANDARYRTTDGVTSWYIGFITPESQFIAFEQGLDTNPTWLAGVLDRAIATGDTTIDGVTWIVYDQRDADDPGNFAYSMSTEVTGGTIVLHGTASDAEFEQLATAVVAELP